MRAAAEGSGVAFTILRRVGGDRLRISVNGAALVDESVAELTTLWRSAFARAIESADVL